MTSFFTKLTSCCTLLVATSLFSASVRADECEHIDELAVKIQVKTRLLIRETVHYRHTASYQQLVAETNNLYRLASHIHDVTHFSGNLRHLEQDLLELDASFHQLEALFDATELNSVYGDRRIRGNTAHVKELLDAIEDCIHHIQVDVATLRSQSRRRTGYRPQYPGPVYNPIIYTRPVVPVVPVAPTYCPSARPPVVHGHGGNRHGQGNGHGRGGNGNHGRSGSSIGFSIGGGSSRINIRF